MPSITLYSTTTCGFCRAAKQLLTDRGIAFTEIDLTNDDALRTQISANAGGYTTVPMIFLGEKFLGGYRELQTLDQSGELQQLLAASRR